MKKRIAMLLCLLFALALTGCGSAGKTGKPGGAQPAGVNDVLAQGMAEADGAKAGSGGFAEALLAGPELCKGCGGIRRSGCGRPPSSAQRLRERRRDRTAPGRHRGR